MVAVQQVCVARSQSGIPGFFTGGYLAMPLTEAQFALSETTEGTQQLDRYARRMGFELVGIKEFA